MKIKKILAFTLALIMTVGIFAGCGAQTETATPAPGGTTTTPGGSTTTETPTGTEIQQGISHAG